MATGTRQEAPLSALRFRGTFRAYQQTVLAEAERDAADGRLHIVAPPGAGKTVIGVELARFFGHPAVVFAPTTTIQQQWLETVGMFTDAPVASVATDDPARTAPLAVFTYQLIATQDHADEDFREAAVRLWAETFVDEGHEQTVAAALARIEAVRANNPAWYRQEEARYRRELRRRLLREDPRSLGTLLHENALRLVDDLVGRGVRTVVLDECHHLLDYWALVIRFLVSRLEHPMVIGLTATPPDPETALEEENYFALLGDVDFEVPTPALVREGTLAPYRDLVRFVSPTPEERRFLKQTDEAFVAAQQALTGSPSFRAWLRATLFGTEPAAAGGAWTAAVATDALLAFSGLRVLRALAGEGVPAGIDVPPVAAREPQFEDWTLVIERYALDMLATSPEAEDHRMQQALRASLKPFGLTLTERGLRRGRSPVDRIVAFSDAKAAGAADILRLELEALGPRLRAAVVCDYDREQARASLPGSLGAGSARGVYAWLANDARLVEELRPVLVTAGVLAAPASLADGIRRRLLDLAGAADLELALAPTEHEGVTAIAAVRGAWTPKRTVALVTDLLEAGELRCVVGTRALLGEGWDAPSLNTLVDLTTATTAQTVQQLRGRTIRLDPRDPHKVAHNWDVVAHVPLVAGGDNDVRRFLRRHDHTWGLVLGKEHEGARRALELPDTMPLAAPIERGPRHVDPDLIAELQGIALTSLTPGQAARRTEKALESANARSRSAVGERDRVRAAWAIGGPSDGIVTESASVRLEEPGLRTTSYVAATTRSLVRSLVATFLLGAAWVAFAALPRASGSGAAVLLVLGLSFAGGLAVSAGLAVRTVRRLLVEEPPDLILLDIGRALALSLADAGLIAMNRDTALRSVWCREDRQRRLLVGLTAGRDDQRLFTSCLGEVFTPGPETRYLVRRTDRRLPAFLGNVVWALLRTVVRRLGAGSARDHFLAVPRVLGRSRKRAETFALHWRTHVGGGQLVDTRDAQAATAILEARSTTRLQALADRIETFAQQHL